LSLVVADVTDDGPLIVSDTRITFPDGPRSSFKTGTLKAIVVTRDVTICFAGDVVAGLDGAREFARGLREGRSFDQLLARLEELASNDRRVVEFIVATGSSGSQLVRIRKSRVENHLATAWIGCQEGFERFQKERNRPPDAMTALLESKLPTAVKVMATLRRALQAVIDDPAIESVGDFSIAVSQSMASSICSTFIHVGRDIHVKSSDNLISKWPNRSKKGIFGFGS
jgi:hypothetical protein